jgi:PPK2 family polyphosphate:nucleotide phosphotransferase
MKHRPVSPGKHLRLDDIDPRATDGVDGREDADDELRDLLKRLYDLHYLMYADNRRSLLVVLQGLDASGKDGTIRHLASGLNPQGLKAYSFKTPSAEELDHDYLWRIHKAAPARGEIAIFNRSHYEEVLVVRVHRELLNHQQLPQEVLENEKFFERRYRQINDFERMLAENGTTILKFMLHVSSDEQKERIEKRLEDPRRQWKFSKADLEERDFRRQYLDAYEKMLKHTSTEHAPWYVIPADRKWYRNYLITKIVVEALERLDMSFPTLDPSRSSGPPV